MRYQRNRAVFNEGRAEFCEHIHGAVRTDEFVFVDNDVAFSLMNRNRYDLAVEFAFLLCFVSILLGTKSQFILVFTSYAKAAGNVFSRYAHMIIVFRADQAVTKKKVFEDAVTHAIAAAAFCDGVRSVGHGFHTASNDDVSVAEFDLLRSQGDGAHAGTTEFIQCESWNFLGNTRVKGNLTGCVFTATGLEYMAHDTSSI